MMNNFFDEPCCDMATTKSGQEFKGAWAYRSLSGEVLGFAVRYEDTIGKNVYPYFKGENDNWQYKAPESPKPLFGLNPTIVNQTLVIICEGEPCAQAFSYLGFAAVTSLGGANSAAHSDWSHLSGIDRAIIFPDNDEPGRLYAADVAAELHSLPKPPKLIEQVDLPNLPDHGGDVIDWLIRKIPDWDGRSPILGEKAAELRREIEDLMLEAREVSVDKKPALDDWGPIIPLGNIEPANWPIGAFPAVFSSYCAQVAAATETPVELACMLGLAAVATAAQRSFSLRVTDDYSEPLCLWVCAILGPGNRKTAVFKLMTSPLMQWEKEARASVEPEIKAAKSLAETIGEQVKARRQTLVKAKDPQNQEDLSIEIISLEASIPVIPVAPQLWTNDITPENLGTVMAENGGRMAILSDEGGILETVGGRYSKGTPNFDLFLQSHSCSPVRVNRGSRPPVFLEQPLLTIGLSPQPNVISDLSRTPSFRGRGFLARFLYAVPRSPLGSRTLKSSPIEPMAADDYRSMLHNLLDKAGPGQPGQSTELQLSQGANDQRLAFASEIEPHLANDGLLSSFVDWGAKLPGAVCRIAGLFHLMNDPDSLIVSEAEMRSAVDVGEALVEHALSAMALLGTDKSDEGAQVILAWIKRNHLRTFKQRDCHYENKARFRRSAQIEEALKLLVDCNVVREQPRSKKNGRPSRIFEVHPQLFTD